MRSKKKIAWHALNQKGAMVGGLLFAALMVAFAWVGWIGSDDARHIGGALGWYEQFPYLPQRHGEFRHFITLPAALSFTLFGISDYSAVLPILLYFFGLLVITLHQMQSRVDGITALLSVALISTMSIFSVRATVVYSDIAEAFFVLMSLWCFFISCDRNKRRIPLLFLAGLLAGAAWLTRETTAALLLFYGLLFLIKFGLPRRLYWVMAPGFFIPVLGDALYFWVEAGTPLYRYTETLSTRAGFSLMRLQAGGLFNDIGNVQLHPLLDPLLALLVNHEVGLLFYLVPFVVWGLWKNRSMDARTRQLALLLMAFAVIWFVVTTLAVKRYHPRYFTVTSYAMALATAIWFTQVLYPRRPRVCLCLAALLLTVGVTGIYVENRNPLFGARTLSGLAARNDEVIHTDPETYRRGLLLFRAEGAEARVSPEPPAAGSLFLFNPNRVSDKLGHCPFRPAADWQPVKTFKEAPKLIATLLTSTGLTRFLHPSIERRLLQPNAPVHLFRVGKETACLG